MDKIIPPARPVSFWKGLVLFYLIFLVVFFAATPFLTFMLYWETDLSTSMLPELIGFCLQGGFLVLVFALYERRSLNEVKSERKYALRTFLAGFIRGSLTSDAGLLTEENSALWHTPEALEREANRMQVEGVNETILSRAVEKANQEVTSMESLTGVAAQIDHRHLEAWMNIIAQVRTLKRAETQETQQEASIALLRAIAKFEELTSL
ncbi:MAG: hypothetical protein HQL50_02260 [Magnetococcales bacterium]|nr:hypothetical protein [Magnetococcales bacterium]